MGDLGLSARDWSDAHEGRIIRIRQRGKETSFATKKISFKKWLLINLKPWRFLLVRLLSKLILPHP
jgi:hypothetical protein